MLVCFDGKSNPRMLIHLRKLLVVASESHHLSLTPQPPRHRLEERESHFPRPVVPSKSSRGLRRRLCDDAEEGFG